MVFILVLREVDANYIGPRIMKSRVGLTPLWIIFFIIIFGGFFGAAGIILAIPTGAFLKVLIQHLFHSTLLPSPVFQKKGNGLSSIESDATMHSPIHSKEE